MSSTLFLRRSSKIRNTVEHKLKSRKSARCGWLLWLIISTRTVLSITFKLSSSSPVNSFHSIHLSPACVLLWQVVKFNRHRFDNLRVILWEVEELSRVTRRLIEVSTCFNKSQHFDGAEQRKSENILANWIMICFVYFFECVLGKRINCSIVPILLTNFFMGSIRGRAKIVRSSKLRFFTLLPRLTFYFIFILFLCAKLLSLNNRQWRGI